ncbi:MAG: EAL domain-containing protein [Erysipelotrichaceae bacterium]|nr:EAL domain-containing protein [Erysipelotrichaceae bacterium]
MEYTEEIVETSKMNSRLALALNKDVNKAMEHFSLEIQPIVNYGEDIIGAEALLRWQYEGKNIPCNIFVPLLESTKAIIKVGEWIIEEALRCVARIRSYRPNFYISINITYIQIYEGNVFSFITRTLEKYRLDGSALIIELTETHIDENPEHLRTFINDCQRLGIRFALDDFGNAYSSLAMLLKYPADIVKLDRSLIKAVVDSKDNKKLLESIVYCCHQLNKQVCVEGVENAQENALVRNIDVDAIQGFYYYEPLNIDKIYELIMKKGQ